LLESGRSLLFALGQHLNTTDHESYRVLQHSKRLVSMAFQKAQDTIKYINGRFIKLPLSIFVPNLIFCQSTL